MRIRLDALLIACLAVLLAAPPSPAIDTSPRPVAADGTYATVDLPVQRHVRNIGGSDGAGLCTMTSIGHSADWHNVPQLVGFQKWMSTRPGGGYPEKIDAEITAYCASQGKPTPAYVQHVGGDEAFLDLAVKTGRMVSVTYAGVDGFYSGPILHMVNLAHLDATHACIIDNNRPGKWVWMTRKEFLNRWRGVYDNGAIMTVRDGRNTYQVGGGWAVVLLAPPPPPYTKNPAVAVNSHLPEAVNFGVRPMPLAPQKPAAEAPPDGDNFGVDAPKLRAVNRKFSLNGTEVSKAVAFAAVLADDSDRYNLTFVGVPIPVGIPAAIRDRSHVQSYAADEWEPRQFGLKSGVTLRKPAANRVASEVIHLDAYDTNAVLAAISGDPVKPEPPAPLPTPLGSVLITLDDLTAAARARLDAAGVSALSLSVMPKSAPVPMPSPVKPSARQSATPPVPVVPVAGDTPTYPAPPGDGWKWDGANWTRPMPVGGGPLIDSTPVFPRLPSCPNGRCPKQ